MGDDDHVFPPTLHARANDPATSHEAVPHNITMLMFLALRTYRGGRAMIDHDACRLAGRDVHQRCSDLRREKFIERRGGRGTTPSGKSAYLCRITLAGTAWLNLMEAKHWDYN